MFETLRSAVRFRRFRFGRATRQLDRAANVMDLRAIAKRRLPGGVFDYIDGGAEDERSLARSMTAFADIEFKPRVLRDVSEIDTTTTLLGEPMAFPFIAAPTGFTRIAHSEGELAVARAAGRADSLHALDPLDPIDRRGRSGETGRNWFQVYVWKDRGLVEEMVRRQSRRLRHDRADRRPRHIRAPRRDVRRGFEYPEIGLDTIVDGIRHPSWTWDFLTGVHPLRQRRRLR